MCLCFELMPALSGYTRGKRRGIHVHKQKKGKICFSFACFTAWAYVSSQLVCLYVYSFIRSFVPSSFIHSFIDFPHRGFSKTSLTFLWDVNEQNIFQIFTSMTDFTICTIFFFVMKGEKGYALFPWFISDNLHYFLITASGPTGEKRRENSVLVLCCWRDLLVW